jgi:hypothetical protein
VQTQRKVGRLPEDAEGFCWRLEPEKATPEKQQQVSNMIGNGYKQKLAWMHKKE